MRLVVDASVAVKWFLPEELSDAADALLTGEHEICAPDFMLVEAANTFWKKVRLDQMTPAKADEALSELAAGVIDIRPTSPLLPRALAMANHIGHPVYDCIYIAAAEAWPAVLVTADHGLAEAVKRGDWKAKYSTLNQWNPSR
ncbi:MAG: type II toxin-antitoxin system VapC family toxin [Proteobacteria bacterium]|nr:type II toxin-antitoxin system VapC family toxin [Pseudomonadota bacterium]